MLDREANHNGIRETNAESTSNWLAQGALCCGNTRCFAHLAESAAAQQRDRLREFAEIQTGAPKPVIDRAALGQGQIDSCEQR